ncbi:hypothetical protein AB0B94_30800 [Micromonospora sp. NPDC048986]|uniref:hypothetical protein n=1 Tax=Micromonospora sp. NPDC048986 TaxID=3155644 RepID=UPI0033EE47D7
MVVTPPAPAPLPFGAGGKTAKTPTPEGAAKMQAWFIDDEGRRRRMPYEVPVDADDQRTKHVRHQCPKMRVVNGGGKERCPEFDWLLPETPDRFCRYHSDKLMPPKEGARLATVAEATYKMYGRAALPWAVPTAGALTDLITDLANVSATAPLLATPVLAGGAYYTTKRALTARAIKRNRIEKGQRDGRRVRHIINESRRAALLAGEAGLWATALTGTDLSTWAGRIIAAAGLIRWAVGAKCWWDRAEARRSREIPATDLKVETPDEQPVEAPDPVRLRALATWATIIGCAGGPLAHTELVDYNQLPACEVRASVRTQLPNWSAKVVAKVPGTINMRESRPTLLGRIAAAYACTYADVSFTADESDLSVGWLRVQPDNLLAETKLWPGPDVANDWPRGRSRIGRFDDGLDIFYQWWTKTGAAHDLISGCTGSGKSELVAQLLLASLHSNGLVLDWVGDPQGGQSYGALKDAVDWFARDASEIKLMLLAALKEMYRRNDELAANNIKTWRPTKAMPLLVITLDEVQSYIDDPVILELVEKLVGQGRKCGIKMRLITQIPAAYNLGGSTYIKEQLKAGQTLIFRAMTDVAGRSAVDGDCPVDPTALPSVWGANTCAAGETTAGLMFAQGINGRDVYGRADYTGDDMQVWLTDTHGQSTLSPASFGRDAQLVSGPLWGDRAERAMRLIAAGRSDADLLSGGKALELIEMASASPVPPVPGQRAPSGGTTQVPAATPKARDAVLAAARAGADSRGVVERATIAAAIQGQMADGTMNKALTDLLADGSLRRIKNGIYEVRQPVSAQQGIKQPAEGAQP